MFQSIGRFDDGLYPKGTSTVKLGRITSTGLVETLDSTEAQVALVDFYRGIDSSPILGPDPTKGMLRAVVKSPSQTSPFNFPTVSAYFWPVNPDKKASYPIISVDEAWNAIKNGKGVIVNVTPKNSNPFLPYSPTRVETILIDKIYLAYYDHPVLQKYLQPIYVFDGKYTTGGTEGGYITLYFPAVTKDWVKTPAPASSAPAAQ
jgi:hypothetical protein